MDAIALADRIHHLKPIGSDLRLLGVVLLCVVLCTLSLTSCSDPGILPRHETRPDGGDWKWYDRPGSFAPQAATYCHDSQALFLKYDHFCPWTGTTIAERNLFFFHLFVSSLMLLCTFVGVIIVNYGSHVS